jgi:hypothetical protein
VDKTRFRIVLSDATALVRQILPSPAYKRLRDLWNSARGGRDWITAFVLGLFYVGTGFGLPKVLFFFGWSPGDDLLCTAVLRELRKRGQDNLLMISNHPGLFVNNKDATYVRPVTGHHSVSGSAPAVYRQFARIWRGDFKRIIYAPFDGIDRSEPPSRHIVANMCASVGITGWVSVRPYLLLTDDEKRGAAWAVDRIVIQSSGMAARRPMANKQWYPERFQEVVDALYGELQFIQLGAFTDPALRNVEDYRAITGIREAAAILHHARLYVGTVGFLMHLARAVECPSVIVFGGREAPWQSGYICNFNLYSAVPCAPCWRFNTCDFDRRCMSDISVSDVVSAVRQMVDRPRSPLAVQTVEIPQTLTSAHQGCRLRPRLEPIFGQPMATE